MKVILNKDIPNLGEEGDIKDVARGYARNYLIPKSLVMPYTRDALSILESRREQLTQRREEKQKAALDIKTRLETEPLVLEMPAGERGRLFGSVTTATIVDALAASGISIERKRVEIPEKTIKSVGTTRVRVRLYGDEEAELRVIVKAAGSTDEVPTVEPTEAAADVGITTAAVGGTAAPDAESASDSAAEAEASSPADPPAAADDGAEPAEE